MNNVNSTLTESVVRGFFNALERGDLPTALGALDNEVEFTLPADEWNAVIPYLGVHRGVAQVERAFAIRAECTRVLDYAMRDLRADGDTAFAVIYTRAEHTRTGQQFEIEDAHRLTVGANGKITRWKVYFDPNGEIAAFNVDRPAQLLDAVKARDAAQVRALLAQGAAPDARDPDSGLTALMLAAGRADAQSVRALLAAGADVFATEPRAGATALHKACQGGSVEVVRALVEAGAFVDAVTPTIGHTPLMDALWFKFPDIVEYLLDQGAGLNLSTHYGFTLKEHFAYELNVNTLGRDRLLAAERLLERRVTSDEAQTRQQRLMAAVNAGDVQAVRDLLASGAAVDERFPRVNGFNDGHTPLLVAARDGHHEIVKVLLAAGADINAVEPCFGAVALHKAVYNGHADITATLVVHPGIDLDFQGATNGYTPLHDALWHGYEQCARILVDAGARLDLTGHDGLTPLDLAAEVFGPGHDLTERIRAAAGGRVPAFADER